MGGWGGGTLTAAAASPGGFRSVARLADVGGAGRRLARALNVKELREWGAYWSLLVRERAATCWLMGEIVVLGEAM